VKRLSAIEVGEHLPKLTLGCFLGDVARRHAEREAIVSKRCRVRYGELGAESRRLARALIGAGVGKGTRVAVLIGNTSEWVTAFFAVGLVGGVLVPVNTNVYGRERR
jgi:fatty-acyl-CoA synthase